MIKQLVLLLQNKSGLDETYKEPGGGGGGGGGVKCVETSKPHS